MFSLHSVDNINYKIVDSPSSVDPKDDTTRILPLQSIVSKVRYVKVFAKKLENYRLGIRAGGDAFIFIDEITIK
jgi:hypothetical protein